MLIATFTLPAQAVALTETLEEFAEITIEAERIAAHSTEWTMPCLWIANADFDRLDAVLDGDPTVSEITESYEFEDEKYYQLEWSNNVIRRIDRYLDEAATIVDATATTQGWDLRIRFGARDQFESFCEQIDQQGYSYELRELMQPGSPRRSMGQLTADQRRALLAAIEHGYYKIPREITATELAAELGISQQALSERLRRATENLVESRLGTADLQTRSGN